MQNWPFFKDCDIGLKYLDFFNFFKFLNLSWLDVTKKYGQVDIEYRGNKNL